MTTAWNANINKLQQLELIQRIRDLYQKHQNIEYIHKLLRSEGTRLAPLTIRNYVEDLIPEVLPLDEKKQKFWKLLDDSLKDCSVPKTTSLARKIGVDWYTAKDWYREFFGKLPELDWKAALDRLYNRGLGKLTVSKLINNKTGCNIGTIRLWLHGNLDSPSIPRLVKQTIVDLDQELPQRKSFKVPKRFVLGSKDRSPPGNLPESFGQKTNRSPAFQQAFQNLIIKGYSQRDILQAWARKRGNTGLQTRLPKTIEFEELVIELDQLWPSQRQDWESAIDAIIKKGYKITDLAKLLKISNGQAGTYYNKKIEPSFKLQKAIVQLSQELPILEWADLDPNAWKQAVQEALDKGYKRKSLCRLLAKRYPEIPFTNAQDWILVARKSPRPPDQLKVIELCKSLPKLPWADLKGNEWGLALQKLLQKTSQETLMKKLGVTEDTLLDWIHGEVVPTVENQWKIINLH